MLLLSRLYAVDPIQHRVLLPPLTWIVAIIAPWVVGHIRVAPIIPLLLLLLLLLLGVTVCAR